MATKQKFSVGQTANGTLGNGGAKLKEMQASQNYNFKFIPKEQIVVNEKNKEYSQDNIDSLKESILVNGLRHNLSVVFIEEDNKYKLISGERRFRAISSMEDNQYEQMFPAGIPCKIEKSNIDEIDEEIMLISANADVRELSMDEKRWQISRLKELYSAKKISGEITNITKEIAKQLEISERQAIRYMNTERLIPELSDILNNNGITLSDASKFSSLPEDSQKKIVELLNKNGNVKDDEYLAIKKMSEQTKEENKRVKEELNKKEIELNKSNQKISVLEQKIQELSGTKEEDDLKAVQAAKNKIEKERDKLKEELDAIKNNKISISDEEYKKAINESKIEQSIAIIESNIKILKSLLDKIDNPEILSKIEILKVKLEEV